MTYPRNISETLFRKVCRCVHNDRCGMMKLRLYQEEYIEMNYKLR